MGFIAVIAAAIAAYVFGAVWYMVMAKPWMEAAGVDPATINRGNPKPYIISFISVVVVAGMMRHIMHLSGLDTPALGLMAGFGLGIFIATPWIFTNYAFAQRPMKLALIDGTYATVGCTIMGVVLTLT